MASMDKAPFFSIIISTRNRPELFQTALRSVLDQSFVDKQVVVVIDGSNDEEMERYNELKKQYHDVMFLQLEHRANGHGSSYSLNYGAYKSSGRYLCFLDDDDHWTDDKYLERLFDCIAASDKPVDVHYSNQRAVFADGTELQTHVWLQDLIPIVKRQDRNHGDSYFVNAEFLLSGGSFAHLNCTALNREFFFSLGGMDESIRYENDRDFFIRSVDTARVILFSTLFMSLHNIPDDSKKNNMSTVNSQIEKKLYQLRVYDKGIALCKNPGIVKYCCKAKVYELKHAASILAENAQYRGAAHYAIEALLSGFNFRWAAYTLYLICRAQFSAGNTSEGSQ